MQPSPRPVGIIVRGARWGLPWLCVLALSACLASVMTLAVAGTQALPEPRDEWVETSPAGQLQIARSDRGDRGDSGDISDGRVLYVGLNSWIRAEPRVAPCPESAAVNAR